MLSYSLGHEQSLMQSNMGYEQLQTSQLFSCCCSLSSYLWSSVFGILLSQIYLQLGFF